MTSYAQEWQADYEKARGTLQSLRGARDDRQVRAYLAWKIVSNSSAGTYISTVQV